MNAEAQTPSRPLILKADPKTDADPKADPDPGQVIADEIRVRLAQLGKSMHQLALEAGMDGTYVRKVVNRDIAHPRLRDIAKLAPLLGCTLLDIQNGTISRKLGHLPPRTRESELAVRLAAARWACWGDDITEAARALQTDVDLLLGMEAGAIPIPRAFLAVVSRVTGCSLQWFEKGSMKGMHPEMAARIGYRLDQELIPPAAGA